MTAWQIALLERALAPAGSPLPPARLLAVLAHPDDEVLALGGRLERLTDARLVTVTDGAPLDGNDARRHGFSTLAAYREARHRELAAALAHAGLPPHLAARSPAMPAVADQQAAFQLVPLTLGLETVLGEFQPEVILTHPYEGGHPDHDACAFAVQTALRLWRAGTQTSTNQAPRPLLLEAPFYHAAAFENGHADGHAGMQTGVFLGSDASPVFTLALSPGEQANKRARLACFRSQAETLAQFDTTAESFRLAPAYDFTQPPHPGKLFYEDFSWGVDGARFRALAAEAESFLLNAAREGAAHSTEAVAASNANTGTGR